MSKPIYILNGPDLNLLGEREPEIYGTDTLDSIRQQVEAHATDAGHKVDFRQTNGEGDLIDWVQEAREKASGVIINAGAYTHTSVALLDALLTLDIPVIEVHLSNPFKREEFRHHSYVSPAATGLICGLGAQGYLRAIDALIELFNNS
ncbi:MAG: type II 3-dehydroquinate dehydratase [Alphaproteobacteria bacterium]|nr:MAG: type II 3-dehydroquinate dehydratase [Alphaproteobacteria bacterium]